MTMATHSPGSTGNNAGYHIDHLAKNSVSTPCYKAVTVNYSLLSGTISAVSTADHLATVTKR